MTVYVTAAQVKAYGSTQGVNNASDDAAINQAIARAESAFDAIVGAGYDQQTYANVSPLSSFIDSNGWLWIKARERGPVTAVTAISIRYLSMSGLWTPITWDATNNIFLPTLDTVPKTPYPDWWQVRVLPSTNLMTIDTRNLAVRWSYTGGFATIPDAIQGIVTRLAWWFYELRNAPLGKVLTLELGVQTVPTSMPPDIRADIESWMRLNG